jgi:RNA polymerase sigma-70 factor (ECF subfamily)
VNYSHHARLALRRATTRWDCRPRIQQTDWAVARAADGTYLAPRRTAATSADELAVSLIWRMAEPEFVDSRDALTGADPATVERAFAVAYEQLRRMAHRYLTGEVTGHTLTTTDLVHQAYLNLAGDARDLWTSESHFMAIAAVAMRRILVDHARRHRSVKRGGGLRRVPLESADFLVEERAEVLLALDEALDRLRQLDARQAQVVECRFFAGMTEDETAKALSIAPRTVKRDWAKARSWLYREMFRDV